MTSPMTLTVLEALRGATLIGPLTLNDVIVDGDATINGNATATGTVQGADLVATDDLTVGDDATIGGDLSVTGTSTLAALLAAAGTFSGLLTTNGQVNFPAVQNPSADPNTLDDYEEGTWTPTIAFGGASVGITYSVRTGTYIKIGRMVTVGMRIILTNKGSSTGGTTITGLPFAVSSSPNATLYSANFAYWSGGASTLNPAGYLTQTSTIISVVNRGGGAVTTNTNADFTNTGDLIITATYLADA